MMLNLQSAHKKTLIFSLLFTIICSSCGKSTDKKAGWTQVNNGGEIALFMDLSTLKINGEARTIFEMRSYKNGKYSNVANTTYFSKVEKATYFCSSASFFSDDVTWYSAENGKGDIIKSFKGSGVQVRIPEGSDLNMVYKYVCSL